MNEHSRLTVTVKRCFKASPERAFDAWLDAAKARQFLFSQGPHNVVHAEIDARVGGSFLFVARRGDKDIDHMGEYLEIDRPRRLVFSLLVPAFSANKNRVAIEIVPLQSGCKLTLTHEGVATSFEQAIFEGWTGFLRELQTTQFELGEREENGRSPVSTTGSLETRRAQE